MRGTGAYVFGGGLLMSFRRIQVGALAAIALLVVAIVASGGAERGPLAGRLIVVDPGHGDHDRGVCHFPSDLIEKEINLDVARRLERSLKAAGAQVVLTRTDDTFVTLDERADLANRLGAHLFVSVHTNRIPNHPECFGAQTFYRPSSQESRRLALLVQEELLRIDSENYRRALPGDYRVLRRTRMPGILVEVGFLTNARDRSLIATEAYRDAVAASITAGIVRFFAESPEPSSAVTPVRPAQPGR